MTPCLVNNIHYFVSDTIVYIFGIGYTKMFRFVLGLI